MSAETNHVFELNENQSHQQISSQERDAGRPSLPGPSGSNSPCFRGSTDNRAAPKRRKLSVPQSLNSNNNSDNNCNNHINTNNNQNNNNGSASPSLIAAPSIEVVSDSGLPITGTRSSSRSNSFSRVPSPQSSQSSSSSSAPSAEPTPDRQRPIPRGSVELRTSFANAARLIVPGLHRRRNRSLVGRYGSTVLNLRFFGMHSGSSTSSSGSSGSSSSSSSGSGDTGSDSSSSGSGGSDSSSSSSSGDDVTTHSGDADDDIDDDADGQSDLSFSTTTSSDESISGEEYLDDLQVVNIQVGIVPDFDLDYIVGSEVEDDLERCPPDEYLKHDPTPESKYPKPDWIAVNELQQRRYGFASARHKHPRRTNMQLFQKNVNNSLWMIQRLKLSKNLAAHNGCVNCLDFNAYGNLICSGSDDLAVCIWDWQSKKLLTKLNTLHIGNVFYCKFCNDEHSIITSSRDGSVRLIDVETGMSNELLSQSGEIGMLAFITPQTLVTCGTNASVNFIDIRCRDTTRLFVVRNPKNNRSCSLYTVNSHPIDKHKLVTAGSSPHVFVYDLRRFGRSHDNDHKPTYCLDNFENANSIVTSTAFNSLGDKLLISYNDDDLFVAKTDTCEIVHRYKGHRNKKTIKGCAWFGDNFVMSGSDDGHIYGWDLESEHIVCFLQGDRGVVNNLCVHPSLPVLASSGLEHDVKVWEPISNTWPQTLKGIKPQICKNAMRRLNSIERRNQVLQARGIHDDDSESPVIEY